MTPDTTGRPVEDGLDRARNMAAGMIAEIQLEGWATVGPDDHDDLVAVMEVAEALTAARQRIAELEGALDDMLQAQQVQPYRGWNITALNRATDDARKLMGLPSIRDLNPGIAKMQDHATANRDALAALAAPPLVPALLDGEGLMTADLPPPAHWRRLKLGRCA